MKKLLLTNFILFIILCVSTVCAEEKSISEMIDRLMLYNDTVALNKVEKANRDCIENMVEEQRGYYAFIHQSSKGREVEEQIREEYILIPEKTFSFYKVDCRYSKQYAKSGDFEYLVNDKYWYPKYTRGGVGHYFDNIGNWFGSITQMMDKEGRNFLYNTKEIEKVVNNSIDEKILDCKIVVLTENHITYKIESDPTTKTDVENVLVTVIYLKGEKEDYGIKIYTADVFKKEESYLEEFKVYTMEEIIQSTSEYVRIKNKEMLETKDTYEPEAILLQNDGLLYGTENGLDLLKPLSRIEATAILVRILGLEDTQTSETSYFTDITSDNWGAKYANIAYDAGIAAGVGNGEFAPDKKITASQFTTLLLRSQNENPDWQTAINLLVEREILTQEQADKMDLFTRGDMAKIIYEMRERGII